MKNNKKIIDLLMILTILAIVSSSIIGRGIGDLDELWNFNVSNVFSKGLLPYIDYNTLVTPLLQMLAGIVLKIFPNELITMRILAVLLISSILFLIYKILDILNVHSTVKIFSLIGIIFLEYKYFCIDYNFFALFLTLIIVLLEIKNENNKDYKYNILIGILAGLVCMTKQTIGMLVATSTIGYMVVFLLIDKFKYKKDVKEQLKNILFRILGVLIPVCVFLIYLICTSSFNAFIDYAILGIKTFSNKVDYKYLVESQNLIIKLLSILTPISFFINFIISLKEKDRKMFIINCLAISMFVVTFPISDNIHFLIGSTTAFITITYNMNNIIKKILKNKNILFIKLFIENFSICILVTIFISGVYVNYANIKNTEYYSKLKHYKFIPISESFETEIKKVEKYIEESDKKVYILNFDAAIYMIPIDRYNKDYDMFMKGNFGAKGEQGIIEKIKKEDAKYLIVKDGIRRNWQNPEEVRKYIKENMKYKESIANYDVYENY